MNKQIRINKNNPFHFNNIFSKSFQYLPFHFNILTHFSTHLKPNKMTTPDLTFLLSKEASRYLTIYQIARRDDSSLFAIERARQQLSDEDFSDFSFCVELLEKFRLTRPNQSPAGEWVNE